MCSCGNIFCDGHHEVMTQCGWCLKLTSGPFAGTKLNYKVSTASHGICEECAPIYFVNETVKRIHRIASAYQQLELA